MEDPQEVFLLLKNCRVNVKCIKVFNVLKIYIYIYIYVLVIFFVSAREEDRTTSDDSAFLKTIWHHRLGTQQWKVEKWNHEISCCVHLKHLNVWLLFRIFSGSNGTNSCPFLSVVF